MNVDDVISYYLGKIVRDRKAVQMNPCKEKEKELNRHLIVLHALICAKANGFSGEE